MFGLPSLGLKYLPSFPPADYNTLKERFSIGNNKAAEDNLLQYMGSTRRNDFPSAVSDALMISGGDEQNVKFIMNQTAIKYILKVSIFKNL